MMEDGGIPSLSMKILPKISALKNKAFS